MYHTSVLLSESIHALAIRPGGIYVDATYGGGGHSREILKHLGDGRLFAFDHDQDAYSNLIEDPRLTLIPNNFRYIRNFLRIYQGLPVDGILADLGLSSHQIDCGERGFSTRFEGILDMRMDRRKKVTARDIVNHYSEKKLVDLFTRYGELSHPFRAASGIVSARKEHEIDTTETLKKALSHCTIKGKENKYYAQVFQALRMEVNQEPDSLKEFLKQCLQVLKPGGRLVVISYHSLEDSLVKNFFRSGNWEGEIRKDFFGNMLTPLRVINRKPIRPSAEEIEVNSRARSARMRIAEKKEND